MLDLLGNVPLSVRAFILMGFIVLLIAVAGIVVFTGLRRQASSNSSTYQLPAADQKGRARQAARAAKAARKQAAAQAKADRAVKPARAPKAPKPARAPKPAKVKPAKEPKPARAPKPAKVKAVKEPKPAKVKAVKEPKPVKGRPAAAAAVIAGPAAGVPLTRLVPVSPAAMQNREADASTAAQDFADEFLAPEPHSILDIPATPPVAAPAAPEQPAAPRLAPTGFGTPTEFDGAFDIAPDDLDVPAAPRLADPESDFDILDTTPTGTSPSAPPAASQPFGAPKTEETEW